jgi:cytochrome P450
MQYINLLITRLHVLTADSDRKFVNIAAWLNFTTFDIIGDLTFGSPFGCLENSSYHPWVQAIFNANAAFGVLTAIKWHAPVLLKIIRYISNAQQNHEAFVREKVDERLAMDTYRPDFMDAMTRVDGNAKLSRDEIDANARILVLAGSETTATALCGAVYFLASDQDIQRKLAAEVRTSFTTEAEIDAFSVQRLKYMPAIIDETLRLFNPVPAGLPRTCQPGGAMICGKYVPAGVSDAEWMHKTTSLMLLPTDKPGNLAVGDEQKSRQLHSP